MGADQADLTLIKTKTDFLPSVAVGAAGGLASHDSVDLIKTKTDFLPSVAVGAAGGLASHNDVKGLVAALPASGKIATQTSLESVVNKLPGGNIASETTLTAAAGEVTA